MNLGTTTIALCLVLGAPGRASDGDARVGAEVRAGAGLEGSLASGVLPSPWRALPHDNVCGLRDLSQLSMPAKIDFERCLEATPEMKRMRKQGIRAQSPEGIQLLNEAINRVSEAANLVRAAGGYCSVWKAIEHRDRRRIPDLTAQVVAQF
jgi:hypothetical protein